MSEFQDIISKCLKDDRAAQQQLYHLHVDNLMSVAYRYCSDISSAKDILQNAFIKIFSHLHTFDDKKGNFTQWSARVVINEALMMKRKTLSKVKEGIADYDAFVDESFLDKMTIDELRKVISMLPETFKIVLNLYYFDEYSHKEIGEILGIKESSSRSQLTRARKLLQERWQKYNLSVSL